MDILWRNPGSSSTYLILILAIMSLWITPLYSSEERTRTLIPLGLALIALIFGVFSQRVNIYGIIALPLLGKLFQALLIGKRGRKGELHLFWITLILSAFFLTHFFPGFSNWKILNEHKISVDTYPFSLYLNFDKPMVGFFILLWSPQLFARRAKDWKVIGQNLLSLYPVMVIVLFLASWFIGYVHWDVKWPYFSWVWLIRNLFMVVMVEEAFFRGLIQERLSVWTKTPLVGLIVGALLFGAFHYGGGPKYILLSTVAGFFYGYIFHRTKKIEASILLHFALNLTHFIFFSYPALEAVSR